MLSDGVFYPPNDFLQKRQHVTLGSSCWYSWSSEYFCVNSFQTLMTAWVTYAPMVDLAWMVLAATRANAQSDSRESIAKQVWTRLRNDYMLWIHPQACIITNISGILSTIHRSHMCFTFADPLNFFNYTYHLICTIDLPSLSSTISTKTDPSKEKTASTTPNVAGTHFDMTVVMKYMHAI